MLLTKPKLVFRNTMVQEIEVSIEAHKAAATLTRPARVDPSSSSTQMDTDTEYHVIKTPRNQSKRSTPQGTPERDGA